MKKKKQNTSRKSASIFQLEPRPLVDPKLNGPFNFFITIQLLSNVQVDWYFFLIICNLASRVAVFVGWSACFQSGVSLVLPQICLHCQLSYVDFNFEISNRCIYNEKL